MLLGMGAVMGYGWYKLIHGIREAKYVPLLSTLIPLLFFSSSYSPTADLAAAWKWRIHMVCGEMLTCWVFVQ